MIETLEGYIANDCKFLYIAHRNAIRVYNKHGVTIQTIDLDGRGDEGAIFDLLTPYL